MSRAISYSSYFMEEVLLDDRCHFSKFYYCTVDVILRGFLALYTRSHLMTGALFQVNLIRSRPISNEKDLFKGFAFVQWREYFHALKRWKVPLNSASPRKMELDIFQLMKYSYHCTHKHSLFAI